MSEAGNTIAVTTAAAAATTRLLLLWVTKNYYYCYYTNPLTLKAKGQTLYTLYHKLLPAGKLNTPARPQAQVLYILHQAKHPCPTTTLSLATLYKALSPSAIHPLSQSLQAASCRQNTGARPQPSPHRKACNPYRLTPITPTLFYITLYNPNP